MEPTLLGTKLGMTRVYTDDGVSMPVTIIKVGPCVVTQIKTPENDGYSAVQIGYGEIKPRNSTMPIIGHDAKAGSEALRHHAEFRVDDASAFELGRELTVADIENVLYVDVSGTSKGKGFAGSIKRHGFKGQLATHGVERKHRSPGSIGGMINRGWSGKLRKGKRMAGHLGDERVTVRNLDVVRVDKDNNVLLVKGAVPGANKGLVRIRPSVKLKPGKAAKVAAAGK
ncbi:MAG: 50S ribosomal protein L3 [Phycisphaeraceae bacterium]|nr:50S ribosomal protein L3 [Phycisphaerales bacterium]MCB9860274.1 50S ribosomal protein L3 [Phycisphaeraceae bacterium]